MQKKRLFVDMDGTLVEWREDATIEEITAPGFFSKGTAVLNVCQAIRRFIKNVPEIEVFILSSVFDDDHSVTEKKEWLKQNLPEIAEENMLFPKYGEPKASVLGSVGQTDYLLDDNSAVLHQWMGTGIKIYTPVNGHHGTWHGYSVNANMMSDILEKQLYAICQMQ